MRIEFRHQAVRDLAWCIGSPSLLVTEQGRFPYPVVDERFCRLALWDRTPWLRELDAHPETLKSWLAAKGARRLGLYFEALIEFWLQHWPRARLRLAHHTIQRSGRDLGEFDFVFVDRPSGSTRHWETAVKFYLCADRDGAPEHWMGPNPADTWQQKRDTMFQRQLRLAETAEAQTLLKSMGLLPVQPMAYIKGYLFYHWQQWKGADLPRSTEFSTAHLRGWWMRVSECEQWLSRDSRWYPLPRLAWLSPLRRFEALPGYSGAELLDELERHFEHHRQALLLAELQPDASGIWREISRGFVVPEDWPSP